MSSLVRAEANAAMDLLESVLLNRFEKIDCPLNHSFGNGLYVREIFMPKGSKVTSKIHKQRHPYFVLKGSANVWIDGVGWKLIEAPHFGWTEPGTRRILNIISDTFWVTVHANPDDTEDLEIIEERLIEHHDNLLLNNTDEARLPQ